MRWFKFNKLYVELQKVHLQTFPIPCYGFRVRQLKPVTIIIVFQ